MTEPWERPLRRVAIGSDHAGFELKEVLKQLLRSKGIEAIDLGTNSPEAADYPDFAEKVARLVSEKRVPQGILICGTGIGMSITANKFPGVRAAVVTNAFTAKSSRAHNDSNILCLGARVVDPEQARELTSIWIDEPFEGGRHERRVQKMKDLDKGIVPLPAKPPGEETK